MKKLISSKCIKIVFFLNLIYLLGCTDDDKIIHNHVEKPNQFSIEKTSFNNIEEKSILSGINKIVNNITKSKLNKGNIYSEDLDLIIDTSEVTYIANADESYDSYTFPIINFNGQNFQNLLFSKNDINGYDIFLVDYLLSNVELNQLMEGYNVDLTNKVIYTPISNFDIANTLLNKSISSCAFAPSQICFEQACEIDGCWDPEYTTLTCIDVMVGDCNLESGGVGGGAYDGGNGDSGGNDGGGDFSGGGTGGGTNYQHDPVDPNDNNNDITIPTFTSLVSQIENCLNAVSLSNPDTGSSIAPGLIESLNLTRQEQTAINDFLINENQCNEAAQLFIIEGIEHEIDFDNLIVEKFEGTKADCVHEMLKSDGTTFTLYDSLLSNFNDLFGDHLILQVGNTGTNWGYTTGQEGLTNNITNESPNFYTVTISDDLNQNGSNLALTVTLIHEIVHAYMYQTLFDADLIDFDQNGDPVTVGNICNMTMNLNNYDLGTKFQNYICTAAQNNSLSIEWTHELFNVDVFSISDYQNAIADYIYQHHDWSNENLDFINTAQSYFGNDWKLHVSDAVSWIGLTQTSEYINYRNNITNPLIKLGIIDIAESKNQINNGNDNCN
jgi:hypothetical protein